MGTKRKGLTPNDLLRLRETMQSGSIDSLEEIRSWIERECGVSYTARGVAKLVERELGAKRVWSFTMNDQTMPLPLPDKRVERFRNFLNSLRASATIQDDIQNLRSAIQILIPEADRVSLYIRLEDYTEANQAASLFSIILNTDNPQSDDIFAHKCNPADSFIDELMLYFQRQGFPTSIYRHPVVFQYPDDNSMMLGILLLWKTKSEPQLTSLELSVLKSIDPFISYLLRSIRDRNKNQFPTSFSFHEAMDKLLATASLSDQEYRIIVLRLLGHTYNAIAKSLHISKSTVHKHIVSAHRKTETDNILTLFSKIFTPRTAMQG